MSIAKVVSEAGAALAAAMRAANDPLDAIWREKVVVLTKVEDVVSGGGGGGGVGGGPQERKVDPLRTRN